MMQNVKLICTSLFLFYTLINETSENQKPKKKSYLKSYKKGLNMNKLNQGDEISILCKL